LIDITTAENGELEINENELSEAVLFLLKSKKKSKIMIEDAFDRFKFFFTNTIMANKYLEVYQRVIK
jgi:glycosyltransferase involved in cell wall biosynthesis